METEVVCGACRGVPMWRPQTGWPDARGPEIEELVLGHDAAADVGGFATEIDPVVRLGCPG